MALRVIRTVFPTGLTHVRTVAAAQKARIHTTPARGLEYGWLAYILGERTTPRFKEYSKIITIDGNLASGKGALAQKLAERLGMLYMPEADAFYLDRMLGEKKPLSSDFNGLCNLEEFYLNPKSGDGNSYRVQLWMYIMRVLQYADALEHLLVTGQGVVLERSLYSDYVFLDAMFKEGYIRKECVNHYNEIKDISICEFLPPHLAIYVDQPADEVQKKLKQGGKPHLQNVSLSFLKGIEDGYKKSFLPQISKTSELLVYSSDKAQEVDQVAEDIEMLKFDKGPWLWQDDVSFHHLRVLMQDKHKVGCLTQIPVFLPEITVGAHEYEALLLAYEALPGKSFSRGYNEDVGDKHIWLK